jgi:ParB family chromosome partitioning protein
MTVADLPLDAIHVPARRLRDFDPAWAEAISRLMAAQGLLQPIIVRSRPRGGWWLVGGRYRLEAARRLGWPTIAARVLETVEDRQVVEAEAFENLGRAELIALDRCRLLSELKDLHDAIHGERRGGDRRSPEARAATAARKAAREADQTEKVVRFDPNEGDLSAFEREVALGTRLSWRTIRLCVQIWKGLSSASRQRLVGTLLAENQSELQLLSAQSAERQAAILALILDPAHPADGVAAAIEAIEGADPMTREERKFHLFAKAFGDLPDERLDHLVRLHGERILASLHRTKVLG